MKKQNNILLLFPILFIIELICIYLDLTVLEKFIKPQILLFCITAFEQLADKKNPIYKWAVFAFWLSLLADVLLMFTGTSELSFLTGIAAFLLSYVFYIIIFGKGLTNNKRLLSKYPLLLRTCE